jgi:hypothetical protein
VGERARGGEKGEKRKGKKRNDDNLINDKKTNKK